MQLRYYYNLLRGKTNAINPAKLDWKHIYAVIQSWVRSIYTKKHIKEQIKWRREMVQLLSPECWKQGHCIQCGCEIIGKTKADMGCENEPYCFPEMMNKKDWKDFKLTHPLID